MNGTKFAQWFYWISIVVLIATALGIIWRLIILPPDLKGLDVVGLAGSILGTAAIVLSVLGAVSVAAWWTSLDKQVTERVKELYKDQQKAVDDQINTLIETQQNKIDRQIGEFKLTISTLEAQLNTSSQTLNHLVSQTKELEKTSIDGLMAIGPSALEDWAMQTTSRQKTIEIPLRMIEEYFKTSDNNWKDAQSEEMVADMLVDAAKNTYERIVSTSLPQIPSPAYYETVSTLDQLSSQVSELSHFDVELSPVGKADINRRRALRWIDTAKNNLEQNDTFNADKLEKLYEENNDALDSYQALVDKRLALAKEASVLASKIKQTLEQLLQARDD